jgi:hypothetical protein
MEQLAVEARVVDVPHHACGRAQERGKKQGSRRGQEDEKREEWNPSLPKMLHEAECRGAGGEWQVASGGCRSKCK